MDVYIWRILHEFSCIIEFIKRFGGKDKMRGFAGLGILSHPSDEFNKFHNTEVGMQDSAYVFNSRSSHQNVKSLPYEWDIFIDVIAYLVHWWIIIFRFSDAMLYDKLW